MKLRICYFIPWRMPDCQLKITHNKTKLLYEGVTNGTQLGRNMQEFSFTSSDLEHAEDRQDILEILLTHPK